jgi:regulator of protease activity HflC (stomatin/prohibitin superfamily)
MKVVTINKKFEKVSGAILVLLIITIACLLLGIRIVDYNEFGVEREFGKLKPDVFSAGFNWLGIGNLILVNNQIRNEEILIESFSLDIQEVKVNLILNIKIKENEVYNFVKDYRSEEIYKQYLTKKIQEKVKTILLKYEAEKILENRENISKNIANSLSELEELKYFEFKDIVLRNIQFSEEFQKIVERKAQVKIERKIIIQEKENIELLKKNIEVLDIDKWFLYQIGSKYTGNDLILGGTMIRSKND